MVNLIGSGINFKTHLWLCLWGISRKEDLRGSLIPAEWAIPSSWGPDIWRSKKRQCCLPSVSDSRWWEQASVLILVRLFSFWWENLTSLPFHYELMLSDSPGIFRTSESDKDLGSSLAGYVVTSATCRPLNYPVLVTQGLINKYPF